ncbi:MAG: SMP-30/gluconolactonase/LRE family protein [bacterium]
MRHSILLLLMLMVFGAAFESGCEGQNSSASPFSNPVSTATPDHPFLSQWGGTGTGLANLNHPTGIAVNAAGTTVYVADQNDDAVKAFSPDGAPLTQWTATLPGALSLDASGDVIVSLADGSGTVQEFSSTGTLLTQGGGSGSASGDFNGSMETAEAGITVYAADSGNNRVQAVTFTGSSGDYAVAQFTGVGSGLTAFDQPSGVALNPTQTLLYIVDTGNSLIQSYSLNGVFQKKWGGAGPGQGQLGQPRGISVDASGDIYVADTGNNRVEIFDSEGNYLSYTGSAGSGTGGLSGPQAVAVDGSGNIYVADTENNLIQKFGP